MKKKLLTFAGHLRSWLTIIIFTWESFAEYWLRVWDNYQRILRGFSKYSHSVPRVSTECSQSIRKVFPGCSQSILRAFPEYSQSIPRVYIWTYLTISRHIWPHLGISGHVRTYLYISRFLWPYLEHLALSVHICRYLVIFGLVFPVFPRVFLWCCHGVPMLFP